MIRQISADECFELKLIMSVWHWKPLANEDEVSPDLTSVKRKPAHKQSHVRK